MFVPKPVKIETKLNSNQSQIYPIDKMHWNNGRVPKAGRKKCATVLCIHKSCQLLLHCAYARPDRKPQEVPEGPRRAPESFRRPWEAPGEPRKHQKAPQDPRSHQDSPGKPQELPGRARKAPGGPRKLLNPAN